MMPVSSYAGIRMLTIETKEVTMLLDHIDSPADLKKLPISRLPELAAEIRAVMLTKLGAHGGHVGPNLGTVELEIAMHYVFDSPRDRFVFDVSHQSYTHKILTGRREAFTDPAKYDEDSGYTNPSESEHDWFNMGHTSTSMSLASGLAKARDLTGGTCNVVAVIGDGSLSGGEAFEGFDVVGEMGTNFIAIVNDNEMSIAENHGGLYGHLRELRESEGLSRNNIFHALGFDYRYVERGNDVAALIEVLGAVKDIDHPIVVHVHTQKGRGFAPAVADKETWHWNGCFDPKTGSSTRLAADADSDGCESYEDLTGAWLLNRMREDPRVVAITSGTPTVMGFTPSMRRKAGKQFVDVGIAEEQAVAMASGIARGGGIPIYGFCSTFVQRAYDQLIQDLCVNGNPAVLLSFDASVYAMNDVTHLGFYDIAMMGNIPNLVYLAPTCKEEYFAMLDWAVTQRERPVAIRVPVYGGVVSRGMPDTTDYRRLNRYEVTRRGRDVAVIGLGDFYGLGERAVDALDTELGVKATLINPKFITGLDRGLLDGLQVDHRVTVTLEDGQLEGGFGEKIAAYYGPTAMRVKTYGVAKSFPDRYDPDRLLADNGVTVPAIVADIRRMLG